MAFCGRRTGTPDRDRVNSYPESDTDLLLTHMSSTRLNTLGAIPAASVYRGTHLPGGRVVSEVGEHASEPMVDFIECPLPLWGFQDGLEVGVRWNKGHAVRVVAEGGSLL